MPLTIAIHPDDYTAPAGKWQDASSPKWADAIRAAGHEVRWVDVFANDILEQLDGCAGLMWRWNHARGMYRVARRLLPVVERTLGLQVYPDQATCWHYDDKIAQHYLLPALGVPTPKTWVFYRREDAEAWADQASYPVVMKLATGAGSENVRLVRNAADAKWWVRQVFNLGRCSLGKKVDWPDRLRMIPRRILRGRYRRDLGSELQIGYAYFQEFLEGNEFDTRVTVIGNRAFAYRRFNRPDDFRASGSGNFTTDPDSIPPSTIDFAFEVARKLGTQSIALDILYRDEAPVINEISYTFVAGMVHACPGHWGSAAPGAPLVWNSGSMWPEQAQAEDFLDRVTAAAAKGAP